MEVFLLLPFHQEPFFGVFKAVAAHVCAFVSWFCTTSWWMDVI